MRNLFLFIIFTVLTEVAVGQFTVSTTAEKTNYEKTSTYDEVMMLIEELSESPYARLESFATTVEGRKVPLLVVGNPLPAGPDDLKDDKRIVVYLQGNIHAGEIEGKEALQMLARDLLNDPESDIMKNVVMLINPILNADGNEKFSIKNRTNQNGPESVGIRYNGQNLDLNRDAMKLETPEIRGLVTNVLNTWDPAILVDCHTTNGSYHEEPTTFVWQMNPNGDRSLINFMRDDMMPKVHRTLWDKYDVENIFYGEFIDRMDYSKGWISYAAEPRFLVNYVGVRNRLAILNENYVYAEYKSRVNASYHLLLTILEYASKNKKEIKSLILEADMITSKVTVADSFAIKYKGQPIPEKITIKAIEADTIPGMKGYWRFKQSDRKVTVTVPYVADYYATENIRFPYAYILSIRDPEVIDLLIAHGIELEQLSASTTLEVEKFKISNLKGADRLFQGHYTNKIEGDWELEEKRFPEGTYVVKTGQKLRWLIAYLMEPQADDGLLYWNYFDRYLVPQWGGNYYPYPVYRLIEKTEVVTN